jgi:hypothetical protein
MTDLTGHANGKPMLVVQIASEEAIGDHFTGALVPTAPMMAVSGHGC